MNTLRRFLAAMPPLILMTCAFPADHNPLLDPRGPGVTAIDIVLPAAIDEGETVMALALVVQRNGVKRPAGDAAWESLTPEVVAVDGTGACRGLAPGRGEVRALLEGMSAMAELEVRPRIDYGSILISEVFYDAEESDTGKEFIEFYNANPYPCDLEGLGVVDGAASSRPYMFPRGCLIGAQSYLVLAASADGFAHLFGRPPDCAGFTFSLNNSGETVTLMGPGDGEIIDRVFIEGGSAEHTAPVEWGSGVLPGADEGNAVFRRALIDTDTHDDWGAGPPTPGW
ncbi:MAG: lamin tail domain-containing protein [Spirochaetes bacterium]|nr:lamin tail domain-containing protein [Spirochaetota bacterium]